MRSHLEANYRFAHLDKRPGTVSLTADPNQTGGWANRAPEATRDALGSVYRLLHSDLGDDWSQSDEGHFWVLAQQMTDPPVIIAVTAPITALRAWPHEHTAADLLEGLIRAGQIRPVPELFLMDPEWRAEPSQLKLAENISRSTDPTRPPPRHVHVR